MKSSTIRMMSLALAMVSVMAFSGLAQARGPMGGGPGFGGPMAGGSALTQEQQVKAQKIYADQYAAMSSVRQEMITKQAELQVQMVSATPDAAKIEALSKEIGALRGKMLVARNDMRAKLTKEGIPTGPGYGMRAGGMAGGRGGHGGHGGGRGGMGFNNQW